MIKEDIKEQIKSAMKARDQVRLSTLKMLSSALHNEEINKREDLNEDEEIAIVRKEAKKRKDAVEVFTKAGSGENAEREEQECLILKEFLPPDMEDDELEQIIADSMKETGASGMQDMGKLMGMVMKKLEGKVDGDRVSEIVRSKLQ